MQLIATPAVLCDKCSKPIFEGEPACNLFSGKLRIDLDSVSAQLLEDDEANYFFHPGCAPLTRAQWQALGSASKGGI